MNGCDHPGHADPADIVESTRGVGRCARPGWYLNRSSSWPHERHWDGYRWDGRTRGTGPLRRWFRRLPEDNKHRLVQAVFLAALVVLAYLSKDTETYDCQFGGGRFDYTC